MKSDIKQTIFRNNYQTADAEEVVEIGVNFLPSPNLEALKKAFNFSQ